MVRVTVDRGRGDLSFYSVGQSQYDAAHWNMYGVHVTFRPEGVGYTYEGEDWRLLDNLSGALKVWVNDRLAWSAVPEDGRHSTCWENVIEGPTTG